MIYERFSDTTSKVMEIAEQEARRAGCVELGTQHILLGIIAERIGVAGDVLREMGIELDQVRREVEKCDKNSDSAVSEGTLPFSQRAENVVNYSMIEALNIGRYEIYPESLLLSILRDRGVAVSVLNQLGLKEEDVRSKVFNDFHKELDEDIDKKMQTLYQEMTLPTYLWSSYSDILMTYFETLGLKSLGVESLHVAIAWNAEIDVLKYIVSLGADVNSKGQNGSTPLHVAAKRDLDGFKYLVSLGADLHAKENTNGDTPLHKAASYNGDVEMLKYILSQGVDVDVKNNLDDTPLHEATRWNNNVDVLKYLVSQGANIDSKNDQGQTLLNSAVGNPNLEVFKYIHSLGLDVQTKFQNGSTLFHVAAAHNYNVDVLKYLVSFGINVNAKNDRGDTAFHGAAYVNPNIDVLKYLVSLGADVNAKGREGTRPIHLATLSSSAENSIEKLIYLVSVGADVNAQDDHGDTALHFAAKWNYVDAMKYLFSVGADLHAKNNRGMTPIKIASSRNSSALKFLVPQNTD